MLASLMYRSLLLTTVIAAANTLPAEARVSQWPTTKALTEGKVVVTAPVTDIDGALKSVDGWTELFSDVRALHKKPTAQCPQAVEIDSRALAQANVFSPTWSEGGLHLTGPLDEPAARVVATEPSGTNRNQASP